MLATIKRFYWKNVVTLIKLFYDFHLYSLNKVGNKNISYFIVEKEKCGQNKIFSS